MCVLLELGFSRFGRFVTTDLVGAVFSGAFSVGALQVRFGFGVWLAA